MREAIIERSIESLLKNGLRFSVDEVAKSLKISKKTVYKYFVSKEELATEIYKTYYDNAMQTIENSKRANAEISVKQLLTVYYKSHCISREEIFNKYALNENIRVLAQNNHSKIKNYVENLLPEGGKKTLMIIIDGTLQKLCGNLAEEENVIERLAEIIC